MLTRRGWGAVGTAAAMWFASRLLGAPELHIVAVGLLALVGLAVATVRWKQESVDATRKLSDRRVFAGSAVQVRLEVNNRGPAPTAVALLEDSVPTSMGRPARALLGRLRPGQRRTVSYQIVCRARGRYRIGPATISFTDAFGLVRQRITLPERHQVIVYPETEDLRIGIPSARGGGAGETTARRVFRAGAEFYAIRPYDTGDDLRRIHWRSTARTGKLMIRQDESARRAAATVFLDTRREAYARNDEAFERAVSAAASIGSLCLRRGLTLRLSTQELPPLQMTAEGILETLALASWSRRRAAVPALLRLRDRVAAGSTLVVVAPCPDAEEITALTASGAAYGRRILVLVHAPGRPHGPPHVLTGAGWEVVPLRPGAALRDAWGVLASPDPGTRLTDVRTPSGTPG